MATIHEVLYRAADLIDDRGWWQSDGWSGGMCAVIAIRAAGGEANHVIFAARAALAEHLGLPAASLSQTVGSIIAWNDAPGRTKDAVVGALRAVGAVAEAAAIIAGADALDAPVVVGARA